MCIFCGAIPMSAAIGIAITGKQHQKREQIQVRSEASAPKNIPAGKMTIAITGSLVVCSAIYHLVIVPRTGVII